MSYLLLVKEIIAGTVSVLAPNSGSHLIRNFAPVWKVPAEDSGGRPRGGGGSEGGGREESLQCFLSWPGRGLELPAAAAASKAAAAAEGCLLLFFISRRIVVGRHDDVDVGVNENRHFGLKSVGNLGRPQNVRKLWPGWSGRTWKRLSLKSWLWLFAKMWSGLSSKTVSQGSFQLDS